MKLKENREIEGQNKMHLFKKITVTFCVIIICFGLLYWVNASYNCFDYGDEFHILYSDEEKYESRHVLKKRKNYELQMALKSFDSLWDFLISPKTSYLDRLAAAYQGTDLFTSSELPKLLQTLEILSEEDKATNWGFRPDPRSTLIPAPKHSRKKSQKRNILGYSWIYPKEDIKYPITIKEKNKAPWPWQVYGVLWTLFMDVRFSKIDKDWFDILLTMPCEKNSQATLIHESLYKLILIDPNLTLSIYRNMLFNPRLTQTYLFSSILWNVGRAKIDPKLTSAFFYDVLKNSPNLAAKDSAVKWIGSSPVFKATSVLFLSQKVLAVERTERVSTIDYAFIVAKLLKNTPFEPSDDWRIASKREIAGNTNQYDKCLEIFKKWFDEYLEEIKKEVEEESKEISFILDNFKSCSLCSE